MRAPSSAEGGFILPFTLVAIASLALIAAVSFRAMARAADIAAAMQEDLALETALAAAEAETAFVFLSSRPIIGGLHTIAAGPGPTTALLDSVSAESLSTGEYWDAAGGARRATFGGARVRALYRDSAGFAPIDNLKEEDLAAFLQIAGFEPEPALEYAAKIKDFTDEDFVRRFRGAERSDYRLLQTPPPTDSPLRSVEELSSVIGLAEAAPPGFWGFIQDLSHLGGFASQPKPGFAPPELLAKMQMFEGDGLSFDPAEAALLETLTPSATARFLLDARMEDGRLTRRRAIDLTRRANAADRPLKRVLAYEKGGAAPQGEAVELEFDELAPIFTTPEGSDSR